MLKSCRPIILTGLSGFLFLLLFIMRLDYSIYLFRTYGLLYSQVLGFCVTAALVLVYRKSFLGKRFSPLFVAMTVLIGYPLFGAFALLAGILMTILALREGKRGFEDLAVALLAGAAAPWLCGELSGIFPGIHRKYVYLAAFPYNRIGGGGGNLCQRDGRPRPDAGAGEVHWRTKRLEDVLLSEPVQARQLPQ